MQPPMDEEILSILEEWNNVKAQLGELFRERNQKNTKALMEIGIDLFIQFLFKSNNKPVLAKESIPFDELAIKPVNIKERLGFIMARPNLYHSYRQLSELVIEQEKQFVKYTAMKKSSRPNA